MSIPINSLSLRVREWMHTSQEGDFEHFKKGEKLFSLVKSRIHSINEVQRAQSKEYSVSGWMMYLGMKDYETTQELRELRQSIDVLEKSLCPVLQAVIALDIHAEDHNGVIINQVTEELQNHGIVVLTKSLFNGTGCKNKNRIETFHTTFKVQKEHYHYWIDDSQMYVVCVPKDYLLADSKKEMLALLDFSPGTLIPVGTEELFNTGYAVPTYERFSQLFSEKPKAKKRIVLSGHGSSDTVSSLNRVEYRKMYAFLKEQLTQFVYISSCGSGATKLWHQSERAERVQKTFTMVLGTVSGEGQIGGDIKKGFFTVLDQILKPGVAPVVSSYQDLFTDQVSDSKHPKLIRFSHSQSVRQPFVTLSPDSSSKYLGLSVLQKGKVERVDRLDYSDVKSLIVKEEWIDLPIKVGSKTVIYPYHLEGFSHFRKLEIPCSLKRFYQYQQETYREVEGQKGLFYIERCRSHKDVVLFLSKETSHIWILGNPKNTFQGLVTIEKYFHSVGKKDFFKQVVIPKFSPELRKQLFLFSSFIEKGGVDLSQEERQFFSQNVPFFIEALLERGKATKEFADWASSNQFIFKIFFKNTLRYGQRELISDSEKLKGVVSEEIYYEVLKKGDMAALSFLDRYGAQNFPKDAELCMGAAILGGEEMAMEVFRRLKLDPGFKILSRQTLFSFAINMNWFRWASKMMTDEKPAGATAHLIDDPLNLLITAARKDEKWLPALHRAIDSGWNPVNEYSYGHRDLPLNLCIELGLYTPFLHLLKKHELGVLKKQTRFHPLSIALDQTDRRFLEVLANPKLSDLNGEISHGITLLVKAIRKRDREAVGDLLHRGASANPLNKRQLPPLSEAVRTGNHAIVQLLLENRGSVLLKEDFPYLIKLFKKNIDKEEFVWKLLFVVYRKPSLFEPNLSQTLIQLFQEKSAFVEWIEAR
jgi:hypothetical protein